MIPVSLYGIMDLIHIFMLYKLNIYVEPYNIINEASSPYKNEEINK